ncbi:LysR family transcriptional regulator [Streptomyces sp. HGB0020]|uniref:LysR family transcriptional regulator n=1 Tax=Streptomyces sp. HGB0020 TaxID=1078086 RepID=UPI00039DC53F|nr:LysR family transcriptional regulator [Streptomyces sp. HGB0020]
MNVELRHLRALVAIDEERTITDAAIALHLSQPALSRTLEQLESRLGVRLVERTTRRLALTGAGQRLSEHARRILGQLDDALSEASGRSGPRPLRLAFAWAALGRHTVPCCATGGNATPGHRSRCAAWTTPKRLCVAARRTWPSCAPGPPTAQG